MREFLKGLDLDKETIDTIMAEYGKQVTGLKEQIEDYKKQEESYKKQEEQNKTKFETYESQIEGLNKTIEENNKSLENLQNLTNENNDLKAQIQMTGANVKKEFIKFVTSEVKERTDDKTDFTKALENYKKENPQYFGDTVIKKVQTSPELTGGDTKPQNTSTIMNDILRGIKN